MIVGPVISWLWGHNTVVHTIVVDSHTSLPSSSSSLVMEKLSGCSRSGQAASLLPQLLYIHNRRIEGSPKLKALLSLRLVTTERWSDGLISLWRLGWPWLWPLVCAPSRRTIQSCSLGPSRTRACQLDLKHKACTDSQRQADCSRISHCAFVSVIPNLLCFFVFFLLSQFCLSPKMSLWMNSNIMYY